MTKMKLQHDEWGRSEVFLAEYHNEIYGGSCVFASLDAAIYFVVTGLGNSVDWSTFPDNRVRSYPYEERNGNEEQRLFPVFRVEREANGKRIWASVRRTAVAENWTVGNGIAAASANWFALATGRPITLSGSGQTLTGKV